jgi:hypothetical protein
MSIERRNELFQRVINLNLEDKVAQADTSDSAFQRLKYATVSCQSAQSAPDNNV